MQDKTIYINKKINPKGLKKDQYDVIIIGAGIGGLVCGCYLAKAGLKVLIIEKNNKVGGYVQSFERDGFVFDTGIHTLVSCRDDGMLGRIINELNLKDKLKLIRVDPSDIIINAGYKVAIRNNINETINDLQDKFPKEAKNIENFFKFIEKAPYQTSFLQFKNNTFKDVLDLYFKDKKLRSILSVLLGNLGLPSYKVSALAAIALYREHLFDGGYYPLGGMQKLPDALKDKFIESGGEVSLSTKVIKIKVNKKNLEGVITDKNNFIKAKYIVSACDVTQTFLELIGEEYCNKKFIQNLKKLQPSISAFLVFLGIKKDLRKYIDKCCGLWYFPIVDIDICFEETQNKFSEKGVFCMFPSFYNNNSNLIESTSIVLMVTMLFIENINYWKKNQSIFEDKILDKFKEIIPISSSIIVKESLTPYWLYKYTSNKNGAMRGWSPISKQLNNNYIKMNLEFKNLFITGHWLTSPISSGGISMVAYSGQKTAKFILNNYKKENK